MSLCTQVSLEWQGVYTIECALLCARSTTCLSYSITNLTDPVGYPQYLCRLSYLSSLGVLERIPVPDTVLYARKI